jgi:phosphoglycolate phosphatase
MSGTSPVDSAPQHLPGCAMVSAVLLDLDGTLLDTAPDLHTAANAMLTALGRAPVECADIRRFVGRGIPNLVKRLLAGSREAADDPLPPPPEALHLFRQAYAQCNGERSRAYPGVHEGLAAFQAMGLPMAVITNKASAFSEPLLLRTGLQRFFSVVVSGDSLPRMKPDALPVIWACGRLGVSPSSALMIGDSANDFYAGDRAGCPVVLLPGGYDEGIDVRSLPCTAVVSDLLEAARWVAGERPDCP